jgi:hypothetical protein
MKTLAAFFLIPLCLSAAISPADLDSLVTAARALPPEFAADALIRTSAVEALDNSRRVELLDEAFHKAAHAEQHYAVRTAIAGLPAAVAVLNKVNQQEFDGLSLQARAVAAMLPLDAARARKLFETIPALKLVPRKCADYTVYDLDRYYQVLAAAGRSFSPSQKDTGEAVRFLRPHIAITSPMQVGPTAVAVAESGVNDGDFTSLVRAFASALGKIQGDDRSFAASYMAGPSIETLVAECKRRKVSPLPLLEAYRVYLVINLSAARCADDDRVQGGGTLAATVEAAAAQQAGDVVGFFNHRLRMEPLQPIQEGESTPSRLEGVVASMQTCPDKECEAVSEQLRALTFTSNGTPVLPGDRLSMDWRNRQRDLLEKMAAWKAGPGAGTAEHFRAKTLLYSDLLSVSPPGEAQDAVIRAELDYLAKSRSEAAGRSEWFLPLNRLLARIALDPVGFAALRADVQKSADPVVALYARLDELAPRPPDRLTLLL